MGEISNYTFELRNVAEALIKEEGIHEGRWMLGFNLSHGVGNMGQDEADTFPGTLVRITGANLRRVSEEVPSFPYVVDAAEVNPKRGKKKAGQTK